MKPNAERLLERIYAAFNARDIDAVLAVMHPNVEWPNGMEGGSVYLRLTGKRPEDVFVGPEPTSSHA